MQSILAGCLLLAAASAGTAEAALPDTLVVCPAEFQPALTPWLAHREEQGHRIQVVEPASTPQGLQRQIRHAAAAGNLRFVVLVGNAPEVPTVHVPAQVNVRWGSEPEIATDAAYADLTGDGLPELAIGRLPVHSTQQLQAVIEKILRYEQAAGHDQWRRRVNIVAGVGGFGRAADMALELVTRSLLTQGIPSGYHTHLTYASWQSPFCPPPAQFRESTIAGFNAGCLFWVYLGHGQRTLLDNIYVPGGAFPILEKSDVAHLRPEAGRPIALLVACYSGAFDGSEDCLAEAMLTSADGPVAVIAGSRVTLPYGNAVLSTELMTECFANRRDTLGELVMHAKRSSCAERADSPFRGALNLLAGLLSPVPSDLSAERREHALLYNLLGDPLLKITHSRDVPLDVPNSVAPGSTLVVRGTSPAVGECTIELVTERGRLAFASPHRDRYQETPAATLEYEQTFQRANDQRYASISFPVSAGAFLAELSVPEAARGVCYVRAFVAGTEEHAVGAARISVAHTTAAD